jgi:membrane protein DedA with SNARE-associated domain
MTGVAIAVAIVGHRRSDGIGHVDNHRRAVLSTSVMALLHDLLALHLGAVAPHHAEGPAVDYYGLAAAAAASWVGLPGPGEPVLIAAGVLAAKHKLDLTTVLLVAWAAATSGGIMGWAIGLKAGRGLLTAPGPLHGLRLRAVARGEKIFQRYTVLAVLLTPSWIAGIHRVRSSVYQPTNAAAAAVWAAGIGIGSYFAGPAVIDVVDDFGTGASVIVAVVIVAAVALELARRHRLRSGAQP